MLHQSDAAKSSMIWHSSSSKAVSLSTESVGERAGKASAAAMLALRADRREQLRGESKCVSRGLQTLMLSAIRL
jgi:hypothetical protein